MSWQKELRDAAEKDRERRAERPRPWWVEFDEPARSVFSEGADAHAVVRTLVGMRLPVASAPTDREGVSCHLLDGVERLVAEESDMRALMRAVRLSGLHGRYRKAGIPKGDPDYRDYEF